MLPPWPVVPPRLWGTLAGGGALAVLNLIFAKEIWWQRPQAAKGSWALRCGLLLAAGAQSIPVLWCWPAAYKGPAVLRPLFRLAVVVVSIGIGLLLPPLLFAFLHLLL